MRKCVFSWFVNISIKLDRKSIFHMCAKCRVVPKSFERQALQYYLGTKSTLGSLMTFFDCLLRYRRDPECRIWHLSNSCTANSHLFMALSEARPCANIFRSIVHHVHAKLEFCNGENMYTHDIIYSTYTMRLLILLHPNISISLSCENSVYFTLEGFHNKQHVRGVARLCEEY